MSRTPAKPNAREITAEKLDELKRNAAAILADVRMNFQREQPFVGSISMSLNLIPTRDSRNPTAATDGTNLYFDIAFLSELSANERMFVLGHEVYHNVMLHFIRQGGRDRELWNIATDMEVNNILATDGLIPPASAIMPSASRLTSLPKSTMSSSLSGRNTSSAKAARPMAKAKAKAKVRAMVKMERATALLHLRLLATLKASLRASSTSTSTTTKTCQAPVTATCRTSTASLVKILTSSRKSKSRLLRRSVKQPFRQLSRLSVSAVSFLLICNVSSASCLNLRSTGKSASRSS